MDTRLTSCFEDQDPLWVKILLLGAGFSLLNEEDIALGEANLALGGEKNLALGDGDLTHNVTHTVALSIGQQL
jgi:hypothetical protein